MRKSLSQIIVWALQQGASDIHLEPNRPVWLRIAGELISFSEYQFSDLQLKDLFFEWLNPLQQNLLAQYQSVDVGYQLENGVRLRINIFLQQHGMSAVMRIIPEKIFSLATLPAPKVFYEFVQEEHGLLLITGPTGCGKSTTLAAMVAEINQHAAKHIITLEDPIEFVHAQQKSLITQRERFTHFTDYPTALRSALRKIQILF